MDLLFKVRERLRCVGYDEPATLELLGADEMSAVRPCSRALPLFLWRTRGGTPLETLVRLFLLNQPAAVGAADRAVEPMSVAEWVGTGLLTLGPDGVRAVVGLLPYQGLVLATDWTGASAPDAVMGVAATTRLLAQMTVRRHVQRAVDLGTGCGIQALLAARHSDHVWATELNPRAIHFARFNAALNGLSNVEFLQGDWLEPVRGQAFDLIVCNPPFVIAPGDGRLHTHSGRSSDQLCQEIIKAVPAFLRPGGFFQLVGDWVQLNGQDWRERMADWLERSGCDAWVLHSDVQAPARYAHHRISETVDGPGTDHFNEWLGYYEREGIAGIVSGLITLRRSGHRPNWVRFDRFPGVSGAGGPAIEQGFQLRDFLEANHNDRDLLSARLCHSGHVSWEARYEASAGDWSAVESQLRLTDGLRFVAHVDPSVAAFVARCRGDQPQRAALAELAEATGQKVDQLAPRFLQVVRRLVERGFLIPWRA